MGGNEPFEIDFGYEFIGEFVSIRLAEAGQQAQHLEHFETGFQADHTLAVPLYHGDILGHAGNYLLPYQVDGVTDSGNVQGLLIGVLYPQFDEETGAATFR